MDNLTETKLTSEKIYSGCILDFYRDTVRLPNGGTAPRAANCARRPASRRASCSRSARSTPPRRTRTRSSGCTSPAA